MTFPSRDVQISFSEDVLIVQKDLTRMGVVFKQLFFIYLIFYPFPIILTILLLGFSNIVLFQFFILILVEIPLYMLYRHFKGLKINIYIKKERKKHNKQEHTL